MVKNNFVDLNFRSRDLVLAHFILSSASYFIFLSHHLMKNKDANMGWKILIRQRTCLICTQTGFKPLVQSSDPLNIWRLGPSIPWALVGWSWWFLIASSGLSTSHQSYCCVLLGLDLTFPEHCLGGPPEVKYTDNACHMHQPKCSCIVSCAPLFSI